MAYVRDNLVRSAGGMKGVYMETTVSGGKAAFDTGLKTIMHATWFDITINGGAGYDFVTNSKRPTFDERYYNIPVFNNGTLEISGGLIEDGHSVQIWAIGE